MSSLVLPLCRQSLYFAILATSEIGLLRAEHGEINVMSVKTLHEIEDTRACLELRLTNIFLVASL